ncbi:site-specific integrase [Candidatus Parcubacteria bacterium]|nr:MAG: site-specific integrase [Candidatus Parcubacteria bacterium]
MDKDKIMRKFQQSYSGLISPATMDKYLDRLKQILDDNVEITSKSKYLQFKAVLNKLREIGIETGVSIPKWSKRGNRQKENVIEKYVPPGQLERIIEACPRTARGEELKKAIEISYYSGLRLEEVLTLKTGDVECNSHIKLNIRGKGSKYRKVYLPLHKKELIEGFDGFSISKEYVKGMVWKIARKTEINFSFHSLRHSFASNFMKAGGGIDLLQRLLGHSNIATTSIYLYAIDESERLQKLGF